MSNCGPICNSCAWNDYHIRCPFDPDAEPAWEPGDLNTMFEKIVADTKYDVQVLSSPETDGPWVITIDNFITEAEAKRFIQLGYDSGYEREASKLVTSTLTVPWSMKYPTIEPLLMLGACPRTIAPQMR